MLGSDSAKGSTTISLTMMLSLKESEEGTTQSGGLHRMNHICSLGKQHENEYINYSVSKKMLTGGRFQK